MATTVKSDLIVPEVYSMYQTQEAVNTASIIRSGALTRDAALEALMARGGDSFNVPSWQTLTGASNVSSDVFADEITASNISTSKEVAVRLSRNLAYGSADILDRLSGEDVMSAISAELGPLWNRNLQTTTLALLAGVLAHNIASDSSDMLHDVSGASYIAGKTDISAGHVIDARATLGELEDNLGMVLMHPVVYARLRKNNLIDSVHDSANSFADGFDRFLGHKVIKSSSMPVTSGVYDSYFLSPNFLKIGFGAPKVPLVLHRDELKGNGGGVETIISRQEWSIHPSGHSFIGTLPAGGGGPSDAATSNNLAAAASWDRVFPNREQVGFVCLRSRES